MSLRHSAGTAVVALTIMASSAAPAAARFDNSSIAPHAPLLPVTTHQPSDGTDWLALGLAGAAGVAVVAAGATATRRRSHTTTLAGSVRTTAGS
jgi:hypothetical protein